MRFILIGLFQSIFSIAYVLGIRRTVTTENIRYAFPSYHSRQRKKIAYGSYMNLAKVFAEILYLQYTSNTKIAQGVKFVNPEIYYNAEKRKKGVIIISGHYANWEWMALAGPLLLHTTYSIIIKNLPSPKIEKFMQRLRTRTGNVLIPSADVRKMFRVLSDGGTLTLLADQSAPSESIRVPFFGYDTPTFEGAARLALRTRASLLFANAIRQIDHNYSVTFTEVSFDDLLDDSIENIRELTLRYTRLLEESIRREPTQWLWLHRRWKYVHR